MALMARQIGRFWLSIEQLGAPAHPGVARYVAYLAYYLSFSAMPLAEATAIFFSSPLMVILLSVLLLGNRISLSRLFTVLIGFLGVFIIIRPGFESVDLAVGLPILSALAYAGLILLTRSVRSTSYDMAGYTILLYLVLSVVTMPLVSRFEGLGSHPSIEFLTRPLAVAIAGRSGSLWTDCGPTFFGRFCPADPGLPDRRSNRRFPFEYFMVPISMVWDCLSLESGLTSSLWSASASLCWVGS